MLESYHLKLFITISAVFIALMVFASDALSTGPYHANFPIEATHGRAREKLEGKSTA